MHGGHHVKGIEVIGHEWPFGGEPSEGNTFDYVYEIEDNSLTIWGGERGSSAYFKGTFSADGDSNEGAWVYPGGGGYESNMPRIQ